VLHSEPLPERCICRKDEGGGVRHHTRSDMHLRSER
jgi:hypothetical protein